MEDDTIGTLEQVFRITLGKQQRMLLTTPPGLLDPIERQHAYLLRMALTPVPCPACQIAICQLSASPDGFDPGGSVPDDSYVCPRCGAKLTWNLALAGTQSFTLNAGQTVTVPDAPKP